MQKEFKKFEIDFTTSFDCEFSLDIVKNDNNLLFELYNDTYDGLDHMIIIIYVPKNYINTFYKKHSIFENITSKDYYIDDETCCSLDQIRNATIEDINEYCKLLKGLEKLHERYI